MRGIDRLECVCVCVCVCERERERVGVSTCVCMCVCVWHSSYIQIVAIAHSGLNVQIVG